MWANAAGAQTVSGLGQSRSRISVVVPCYNYGQYLRACVDSALSGQGDLPIEVIIVDDASTDDSHAVALSIAATDTRVAVFRNRVNAGHISTYNHGISLAHGDYVLLLSADDAVPPMALANACAALDAAPSAGLAYGQSIDFTGDPPKVANVAPQLIVWPGQQWLRRRATVGYNPVATPCAVIRRSVISRLGGYDRTLPHAADFEFWLRIARHFDVAFLGGSIQGLSRFHGANMQIRQHGWGALDYYTIDLPQRLRAFEVALHEPRTQAEQEVLETALATLHRQAQRLALHALNLGMGDVSAQFETIANTIGHRAGRSVPARLLSALRNAERTKGPVGLFAELYRTYYRAEGNLARRRTALIGG